MSCSMCTSEHIERMRQDSFDSRVSEDLKERLGTQKVIKLKRGGCFVNSAAGPIQFGMPPETVKDHMTMGSEVPTHYILPTQRFHKRMGINVAEFEFPAYFNFFIRKKQINLICTKEAEEAIRIVFQETLIGPKEHPFLANEFYYTFDKSAIPDFPKERSYFATNPLKPSELVNIDTLIRFTIFDENGIAQLENDVTVQMDSEHFLILEAGYEVARIKDDVENLVNPQFHEYENTSLSPFTFMDKTCKPFDPPLFGVTVLGASHGFDPIGSTSGYIIWINGRGIMLDPPPFSSFLLKKHAIPSSLIESVIISHCHADHDAGAFQKILESQKIEFITTKTVMESFVRKYSALTGMNDDLLRKLFKFRPVIIGAPMVIHGAQFRFFYSLHTIPCIGLEVYYNDRSIFFSGDTCYDPSRILEMKQQGLITQRRYEMLVNIKWNYDLIIHEAGVPPIHTPVSVLAQLPTHVKDKMILAHIAKKDIPKDVGLQGAEPGLENTLVIDVIPHKGLPIYKKIDLLSQIDIFDGISLKAARDLIQCSTEEHYKAGQIILKEGTSGVKFYLIQKGICKIYSEKGDSNFVRYAVAGDYFGESILLNNNSRRGATVEAITDVTLFVVEKHDLWFVLGDDKGIDSPAIQRLFNLSKSRMSKAFTTISKNMMLSEMSQTQKTQLEMILKEQEVPEKTILWKSGSKAEFGFLVVKGAFKFTSCKEAEHGTFEKGAFIGEVNAMLHNEPLTTTVKAATDGVIYVVKTEDFQGFLAKNPGLLVLFKDMKFFE